MQQSAARQQQLGSPTQDRQQILTKGSGGFGITDQFGAASQISTNANQARQFTSGGFGNGYSNNQQAQHMEGQSSIAMRLLQQKQQRESTRMGGPSAADAGSDINLYGANPFGGLHQPIPVSSGESDQTYNIGARTEYGMLQQNQKNNPMET